MNRRRSNRYMSFFKHQLSAEYRGIPFLLTFLEWISIWEESGHFSERGCGKGRYCMARYGDIGPYAIGNVKIITQQQNSRDRKGYKHSLKARIKMSSSHKGKTHSFESRLKIGLAGKGRVRLQETRDKISKALSGCVRSQYTKDKLRIIRMGRKHSLETRAKMSRSHQLRLMEGIC
jgi:hypothetical protein